MIVSDALRDRARDLVRDGRRAILGVAGPPGAGKSTFVADLVEALRPAPPAGLLPGAWLAHVPMDGFHLADAELERLGRQSRKGAPDTFDVTGYLRLLERIRQFDDEVVYAPGYRRDTDQVFAARIPVAPSARLIVTEGNYLLLREGLWPQVRRLLDEAWYIDLDDDPRLTRLIARHMTHGKDAAAAFAWAHGPDQANALRITPTRDDADLLVRSDGDAWVTSGGAP